MTLVLVTGGIRSGKSAVAERLAAESAAPVAYVATGSRSDPEMAARIEAHQARRPEGWRTVETEDPVGVVADADRSTALIDSLGSWLAGALHGAGAFDGEPGDGDVFEAVGGGLLERVEQLAAAARSRAGLTIVVTEEAGLGPVPVGAPVRAYLDLLGEANQIVARAAERVLLVVAGRTVELGSSEPRLHDALGGSEDLGAHGDTMVPAGCEDFAVNIQGGGPPPFVRDALVAALDDVGDYPDEGAAIEAVARRHGRGADEVVLTNGAVDALWLIARALRPRHAVCVHPSFTEPEVALRFERVPVTRVMRQSSDFALVAERVPDDADLIVVGNPNNPTGTLDPADELARLCRPGRVVIVDEAFMEFVPDERSSVAGRTDLPGLIVVRSLTKLWAIPGVRVGYALAAPELVERLAAGRPPWSANAFAIAAIRAWTGSLADVGATVAAEVAESRQALSRALASLPDVRVWPSAANFVLVRVPDGGAVYRRLLERGFAVRPCWNFPGLDHDYLRIAVRDAASNRRLVAAFDEVLTSAVVTQ